MPDHTEVSDNWAIILPNVLSHIVDQLSQLLPRDLALLSTGAQVVLSTTTGQPRVVATETPGFPGEMERAALPEAAARLLTDVQDLVITHLATPWPLSPSGRPTYPASDLTDNSLMFWFSPKDGGDADSIALQPYDVPEDPPEVVTAG